jgi:hypothetical protein
MASATLVSFDIEIGDEIIAALDKSGMRPNVAIWAVFAEYGDARLVLASRKFPQQTALAAYTEILPALDREGINAYRQPAIVVLPMKDPGVQSLRKRYGKVGNLRSMRLGPESFGRRFLEAGYVYRIE